MILILSGTADGRRIAVELNKRGFKVLVTTVTGYGKMLLQRESCGGLEVQEGSLDAAALEKVITGKEISLVIDATHPFALQVSKTAVEVCGRLGIRYIRYEREKTGMQEDPHGIVFVNTFEEAARQAAAFPDNVFLTVGSKNLAVFCEVIPPERIIARVLPQGDILEKCEELGLQPRNIVALQGPFTRELNRELFKQYRAGVVVTKDSGRTGGAEEKIEAARELGIPVIVISRPEMEYPVVVREIEEIFEKIKDLR